MNPELLNFIKSLSLKDKKNLSQKALKTCEEVGELAKAVLPFENAHGTKHRFSDREKILDNVVDVILSSISIAYDLGYSDEDIQEMMEAKSTKWLELQSKEDNVQYPIPYEIHITVKNTGNVEQFKNVCSKIGVKPLVLDLQKDSETVMLDMQTSSIHFGDNRSAYDKVLEISNFLSDNGFEVLRKKIETVPWHSAAPTNNDSNPVMPNGCYFESHLQIVATNDNRNMLNDIAKKHNAHLSRNFFKKISDSEYIIMITYRKYDGTIEIFRDELGKLKNSLTESGFKFDKEIVEFSIYDTKLNHDYNWLK